MRHAGRPLLVQQNAKLRPCCGAGSCTTSGLSLQSTSFSHSVRLAAVLICRAHLRCVVARTAALRLFSIRRPLRLRLGHGLAHLHDVALRLFDLLQRSAPPVQCARRPGGWPVNTVLVHCLEGLVEPWNHVDTLLVPLASDIYSFALVCHAGVGGLPNAVADRDDAHLLHIQGEQWVMVWSCGSTLSFTRRG